MHEMDVKEKSTNHYSLAYDRPEVEETGFLNFLYNKKTGEVLGRNFMSWVKITIFYIIYYICLGIFFWTCYMIFAHISLVDGRPRWTLSESLIGSNPGVGFRPMPDQDKNTDSSLIWINRKKEVDANSSYWVGELDAFFKAMPKKPTLGADCTFANKKQASDDVVCNIDASALAGCHNRNNYGYGYYDGTPCVLIKLNKIFDFKPVPYKAEDMDLAKEKGMPDYLWKNIEKLSKSMSPQLDSTWITCEGENPGDKESIGTLKYYAPGYTGDFAGIPNYFYPFSNQEGYQTPFLFVKFEKPRPHTLIQIECKAWAKNIQADRQMRLGSVHFELMID